jgi:hypothetical protein
MDITEEDFRKFAMSSKRPIPGESLTTNPETPWAWETPPEFTSKDEALAFFFDTLREPKRLQAIVESLEEGVPIMDLVEMFLRESFQSGQINPDLLLILAEPLAFMIMALGERAGIEDIKIVEDPDDPDEDEDEVNEKQFNQFKKLLGTITEPKDDEDFQIEEKLDEVELPSLMARGEQ